MILDPKRDKILSDANEALRQSQAFLATQERKKTMNQKPTLMNKEWSDHLATVNGLLSRMVKLEQRVEMLETLVDEIVNVEMEDED